MKVRVRFFGRCRQASGAELVEWELAPYAGLNSLRAEVEARFAGINTSGAAWAVNAEVVNGERVLKEGDEVAVLPPVSGG